MVSAAPTILALETDSAWVMVLAVSAVTLTAALVLRRLIGRPGGVGAGLLLALPLLLPIVAALAFERAVLPEIAVLKPVGAALLDGSGRLLHVLLVSDGASNRVVPYAFSGSAGPWLLLIGLSVSAFMLLRRLVGTVMVRRLLRRCRPLGRGEVETRALERAEGLARAVGLRKPPDLLVLPPGLPGAFVVGARRPRVLISPDLLELLEEDELEAVLAHEIAHLESRDVPVAVGAGLLRDMVAWNPLAHIAFRRLLADRELEADRRAASLTGRPLELASGLLKMCKLVRGARARTAWAGLGAVRPGGRVSRRVGNLLALADGRLEPVSPGKLPYLAAALLVAMLGLQAGARLAAQDATAFAIVVGNTSSLDGSPWAPKRERSRALRQQQNDGTSAARGGRVARTPRYPELLDGVVKEKDLPRWVRTLERLAARLNVSPTTLRWQARAVPLLDQSTVGPISFIRMETQLGGL